MNRFGFDPYTLSKQRQQEILKEVEQYRLVKEVLNAREPQDHNLSIVLAQIGRKMTDLGLSLQERYGDPAQIDSRFIRQGETGDCL